MPHTNSLLRSAAYLTVLGSLALSSPSLAFDCSQAKTTTEKAICASSDLQDADATLNATYRLVKSQLPPAQFAKIRDEQVAWLKGNDDACKGDQPCLKSRYALRIKELKDGNTTAAPQVTGALSYKTITVKKDKPYELDLSYPRFSGPDEEKAAKLNAFITKITKACDSPGTKDIPSTFFAEASVLKLSDDLAVIRNTYDLYCYQAAHPSHGTETYFVPTQTGVAVNLWETLPEAGQKILRQRIAQAAATNIPKTDECREHFTAQSLNDAFVALGYSGDNVFTIQPRLPHYAQACEDYAGATITAEELQKLYPPQSLANTLIKNLMSSPSK